MTLKSYLIPTIKSLKEFMNL